MNPLLECAVPSKTSHCMNISKRLKCGHNICSDCFKKRLERKSFGCKHCGDKIHNSDISNAAGSTFPKQSSFDVMFNDTIQKYEQNSKELTELLFKIGKDAVFISDEIDIRVESLKNELDNFREELIKDISTKTEQFSLELRNKLLDNRDDLYDIKRIPDRTMCSAGFVDYFKKLLNYDKVENYRNKLVDAVNFKEEFNLKRLYSICVGPINHDIIINKPKKSKSFKECLETKTYSTFELGIKDVEIKYVIGLPNNTLLIQKPIELVFYDSDFHEIKSVKSIQEFSAVFRSAAALECNRIYFTGYDGLIIMTDFDLNFIKQHKHEALVVTYPRVISSNNELYSYYYAKKDSVFSYEFCKFTAELNVVETFRLKDMPIIKDIRILNHTVCVLGSNKGNILFYSLNDKMLKFLFEYEIDIDLDSIYLYDNRFYVSNSDSYISNKQTFLCFDPLGETFEKIEVTKPRENWVFKNLIEFDGKLFNTFAIGGNLQRENIGFARFNNYAEEVNAFNDDDRQSEVSTTDEYEPAYAENEPDDDDDEGGEDNYYQDNRNLNRYVPPHLRHTRYENDSDVNPYSRDDDDYGNDYYDPDYVDDEDAQFSDINDNYDDYGDYDDYDQ